jgi:16S rRNA (uracil1498-N3)-methyltransferase
VRPRFFVDADLAPSPGEDVAPLDVILELSPRDSRHARTVLRARAGERCEIVFEGSRAVAEAVFEEVGERVSVRAIGWIESGPPPRVRLLLVQGLPQPKKVDEIIEKGTEVGIDSFLIVPAAGSPRLPFERLVKRAERWRTIATEAAKQSRQSAIPDVLLGAGPDEALAFTRTHGWRSVLLVPSAQDHLGVVVADPASDTAGLEHWALWVGPEGGWSDDEVALLSAAGCMPATLGARVLRTETAGPVAGALTRYVLSDW